MVSNTLSHLCLALDYVIALVAGWRYACVLVYEVVPLGVLVGQHEVVLLLDELLPVEVLLVGGLGDEMVVQVLRCLVWHEGVGAFG
tara:strand:+ start:47 stop:304 length:258 start_codon:yes stop_codon:yes gene_type:complete